MLRIQTRPPLAEPPAAAWRRDGEVDDQACDTARRPARVLSRIDATSGPVGTVVRTCSAAGPAPAPRPGRRPRRARAACEREQLDAQRLDLLLGARRRAARSRRSPAHPQPQLGHAEDPCQPRPDDVDRLYLREREAQRCRRSSPVSIRRSSSSIRQRVTSQETNGEHDERDDRELGARAAQTSSPPNA